MGTGGLIGFIIKGKARGTYNHFDSYPRGLGKDVLDFILFLNEEGIKEMQRLVENVGCPPATFGLSVSLTASLSGWNNKTWRGSIKNPPRGYITMSRSILENTGTVAATSSGMLPNTKRSSNQDAMKICYSSSRAVNA